MKLDEKPTTTPFHRSTSIHTPSSYDYYDILYNYLKSTNFSESQRVGAVEVVPPLSTSFNNSQTIQTSQEFALLPTTTISGYSAEAFDANGTRVVFTYEGWDIYSYADSVGLLMGIYHFNNGIGRVVKEVEGINKTCNIRLTTEIFDSESSKSTAVDVFLRELSKYPNRPPSTLFGAYRSVVSVPLAILSGVYQVPQISPYSTSTQLDDHEQFNYFSRLIPSDAGTAKSVVDYLRFRLNVTHCGVIFINDSYGGAYIQSFKENAVNRPEEDQIIVKSFGFTYDSEDELKLAMSQMKDSQYRVFFALLYEEQYETVMMEAYQLGIVGPGYVWIFGDGVSSFSWNRKYPKDSPLAIATQGVGIIMATSGMETSSGNSGQDRFIQAWYDQDDDAVSYYNRKQPTNNTMNNVDDLYYIAKPGFFKPDRRISPPPGAVFHYDSAIGLGLAACRLVSRDETKSYFHTKELFDEFVESSFEGASGKIKMNRKTATRDPSSITYVIYNINGVQEDDENVQFEISIVSHSVENLDNTSDAILWRDLPGKAFIYSDGTTQFPPCLPPIEGENLNQLNNVRYGGLTLSAVILLCSMGFAFWTWRYRAVRVVKTSQPPFLVMICFGTFLMGSSIITSSIDDQIASIRVCDVACMANLWLLTLGFVVVFSALFSKIWRINKIFRNIQDRQITVTIKEVMLPFIILTLLNTIILLVWTLISPMKWKRINKDGTDQFGRPVESYGQCSIQTNIDIVYIVLLLIVNVSVLILANVQAYQARSITDEFSEVKYVAIVMLSISQSVVIGLPVAALVRKYPPAFFFILSVMIFVISMSILLLMYVPKMIQMKKSWQDLKH